MAREFKKYDDIFSIRGKKYHEAMNLIPDARHFEFENLFKHYKPKSFDVIVDMPSGGGYLRKYLNETVKYIPLEVTSDFGLKDVFELCSWSQLPLVKSSVDALICCAAIHHVDTPDRISFFKEAHRVLKKNGRLIIADIEVGTTQDAFLNDFVNQNNAMGHVGNFIDNEFGENLTKFDFKLESNECIKYPWLLSNDLSTSIEFIENMFGLDLASDSKIEEALEDKLNFRKSCSTSRWQIDWQLRFVTCKKK